MPICQKSYLLNNSKSHDRDDIQAPRTRARMKTADAEDMYDGIRIETVWLRLQSPA